MKLAIVLPLLSLAACGPKAAGPSTPPPPANTAAAVDAAPAYAPMFVAGTTWRFEVVAVHSMDGETTKSGGLAVCTVAKVGTFQGGQLSEISCDDTWPSDLGSDPLVGVWASTERGLWQIDGWPADGAAPTLADENMVMAAAPVAATTERHEPGFEDPVAHTTIVQKGDSWCHTDAVTMGDEAWTTICFGPGGVTGGDMGWAGGSVHEATFMLVR